MRRSIPFALALVASWVTGCAEEIQGPPLSLEPGLSPATVCNASDAKNQALQTRVVFRAAAGASFAPLPVDTLTLDASLAIPRVQLRAADGAEVLVRQVEFVTPREVALWVTRSTRDGAPLAEGSCTVTATNPSVKLGPFAAATPLTGIANAAVEHGGYLYVLGGANASGAPQNSVHRARVLDFSTSPSVADPEITRAPGGGLSPGAWIYRVAAVMSPSDTDNPGGETLPSDEVTAFFVFTSTVRLRWTPVAGAASYKIYRAPGVNGASGSETLLATAPSTASAYTDDGTPVAASAGIDTQPLVIGSTGVGSALSSSLTTRAMTAAAIAPDPSGNLFLYALTGHGASGPLASWEYSPLSADGARLGAFTPGLSPLPTAREFAATAVANARSAPDVTGGSVVYIVGRVRRLGGAAHHGVGARVVGRRAGLGGRHELVLAAARRARRDRRQRRVLRDGRHQRGRDGLGARLNQPLDAGRERRSGELLERLVVDGLGPTELRSSPRQRLLLRRWRNEHRRQRAQRRRAGPLLTPSEHRA